LGLPAATHGSPWRYDTYVPVIFAGNGLPAKTVFREVETVDVALTLSKYLNQCTFRRNGGGSYRSTQSINNFAIGRVPRGLLKLIMKLIEITFVTP
jgi:hypothetical protein